MTEILKACNFDKLCAQLLEALIAGYAISEIVWTAGADQQAAITNLLSRAGAPVVDGWIDHIQALVRSTDDPQHLQDALLAAYGSLPTEQLADVMALAFELADLTARHQALGEMGERGHG